VAANGGAALHACWRAVLPENGVSRCQRLLLAALPPPLRRADGHLLVNQRT